MLAAPVHRRYLATITGSFFMAYKKDNSLNEVSLRGSKKEQQLFTDVILHYQMAKEDLESRYGDWDTKDELFRSFINEKNWPYNAIIFDPRTFTFIFEKTSRLLANKPRGRMVPREGGDALGAKINNELLKFQWDENERVDSMPMIAKWAMMDMNARKYGASFGLSKWHWQRYTKKNGKNKKGEDQYKSVPWFDGPNFKPLINRDCLPNPSYSTVKLWFQHRDYLTIKELKDTNDAARSKPVYKNLDLLRQAVKDSEDRGVVDSRESNWTSRNKSIKDLTDYLGRDETNKVIEVITEYRNERWITFAPKHGVILRDIPNPYDHCQIPVVMLRYYPIDDDLYGLSEIEPIQSLQKGTNALLNQNVDTLNMGLNNILKVRSTGVQMHTLEFGPGKKWIMNDPSSDVIEHQFNPTGIREFPGNYRLLVSSMQEALGETSLGVSGIDPTSGDKTATEIKDSAMQRNARDNFNQIFLSEAIKKQMVFWHLMNKQFIFDNPSEQQKVIRIVGKDAIRYFEKMGLNKYAVSDEAGELLSKPEIAEVTSQLGMRAEEFAQPLYPVGVKGESLPKFNVEPMSENGSLIIEPDDLSGTYDFIPDIESMQLPDDQQVLAAKRQMIELVKDPAMTQLLMQESYKLKVKEMLEDYFEDLGMKDADKYFEKAEQQLPMQGGNNGQIGQAGEAGVIPGQVGQGNGQPQGVAGGAKAFFGGQAQPVVPGPGPV